MVQESIVLLKNTQVAQGGVPVELIVCNKPIKAAALAGVGVQQMQLDCMDPVALLAGLPSAAQATAQQAGCPQALAAAPLACCCSLLVYAVAFMCTKDELLCLPACLQNALPLARASLRRVHLVGPWADNAVYQLGSYYVSFPLSALFAYQLVLSLHHVCDGKARRHLQCGQLLESASKSLPHSLSNCCVC